MHPLRRRRGGGHAAQSDTPDAFLLVEPCPPSDDAVLLSRLRSRPDAEWPVLVLGVDDATLRTRLLDLGADDVLPASVGPTSSWPGSAGGPRCSVAPRGR